eukprot:5421570-Amphidinium_carterae.1
MTDPPPDVRNPFVSISRCSALTAARASPSAHLPATPLVVPSPCVGCSPQHSYDGTPRGDPAF